MLSQDSEYICNVWRRLRCYEEVVKPTWIEKRYAFLFTYRCLCKKDMNPVCFQVLKLDWNGWTKGRRSPAESSEHSKEMVSLGHPLVIYTINGCTYSFVPCTTCVQVHVFSKKLCFPKNSCFLWENTFILVVHYNKRPIILKGWYMRIKDRMAKRNKPINSFKSHLIRKWTCKLPWTNVVTKPLDLRSALWEQDNFYAYHFYSSRAFILTLWLNMFFNMQVHNIPLFYEFTYEIKLASLFRGEFLQEAE